MKKASSELEKFLARKAFNKKAETSAAAALSIGDLIYDMARIDPTYVRGAQFSRPNTDIDTKFKNESTADYFNLIKNDLLR